MYVTIATPDLSLFLLFSNSNSSLYEFLPRGETTHVITHLTLYNNVEHQFYKKLNNGPTYISRPFKQFLQCSIKHITDIPYNPQA